MRKKILIIISSCLIGCVIYTLPKLLAETPPIKTQWTKKYPQLANNIGFAKLVESNPTVIKHSDKIKDLIGPVSNEFGIRDEVLTLILQTIPESDVRSTIAAIKMIQFYQAQVGVTNDKEMNKLANKASAASSCINIPMMDRYNFGQSYDKIIRDTSDRQDEQDRIEHLLSGHVISADYGIQSYDPKEQCDHFLGESK